MANGTVSTLKWTLGIVLGILLTAAVGLGGWNLNKTAQIPENYATKEDLKEAKDDARGDRDQIRKDVADKLEDVQREQRYLRKGFDDLNNFIREHTVQ